MNLKTPICKKQTQSFVANKPKKKTPRTITLAEHKRMDNMKHKLIHYIDDLQAKVTDQNQITKLKRAKKALQAVVTARSYY